MLSRESAVREAVVMAQEDLAGDKRLVAYVVSEQTALGQEPWSTSLKHEQVHNWQILYDDLYQRSRAENNGLNLAGWNSSYSGGPIPAEQMIEWRDATVARIRELKPKRVLEIGCGAVCCCCHWRRNARPTGALTSRRLRWTTCGARRRKLAEYICLKQAEQLMTYPKASSIPSFLTRSCSTSRARITCWKCWKAHCEFLRLAERSSSAMCVICSCWKRSIYRSNCGARMPRWTRKSCGNECASSAFGD